MDNDNDYLMDFELRPMREADIMQAAQVDKDAFPENTYTPPFKRDLRTSRLANYLVAASTEAPYDDYAPQHGLPTIGGGDGKQRRRHGRLTTALRRFFGAEDDSTPPTEELIAGYLGLWSVVDESHITSVGVRSSHRGKGIGELLIIGAVEISRLLDCRQVTLEVRVSNEVAQNLYKKYGFRVVGRRKRYYTDNGEDAYVMTTDPIDSAAYTELFSGLSSAHSNRWGVSTRMYESADEDV